MSARVWVRRHPLAGATAPVGRMMDDAEDARRLGPPQPTIEILF